MTDDLMNIYRQRVLDHSREPHNQRRPDHVDRQVTGFNPLCGDKLTVFLTVNENTVADIAFEGTGCAISIASASMMTDALRSLPIDRAGQLIDDIDAMFTDGSVPEDPRLQEIRALENVRSYPSRIKCATLAWSAASTALHDQGDQVTTE